MCYKYNLSYYQRNLPHWQPDGAAIFLTWRLHGSIPAILAAPEFGAADRTLNLAVVGPRWLADERVARCVAEVLRYGEERLGLYHLRAWVLMVNHVHILIYPEAGITRITRTVKGYSARRANEILGRTGQRFWQDESYDHWVRGRDELEKIVHYIEWNPVTAGLVSRVEDWRWSSAFTGF